MSRGRPLLETVHGLLERTYRMECGLRELAPFVIGDRGYREIYGGRELHQSVGSEQGTGPRTLLREIGGTVLARVYFPDAMIRRLEAHPPQRGLTESNVDAFAAFVEEIDHLLVVAERARLERTVSLFELELHANVSKYLVLARFLARHARPLGALERLWLRQRLFGGHAYGDSDPVARPRYREAARCAVRFLERIHEVASVERLPLLRRFHDETARGKLRLIERPS